MLSVLMAGCLALPVRFVNATIASVLNAIAVGVVVGTLQPVSDQTGLPERRSDHADAAADMALDLREALDDASRAIGHALQIRIGLCSGPAVAGAIGSRKFAYDLWGDTVNMAARMESHGAPGEIHVTESTYEILRDRYVFEQRGPIDVKGKGPMRTYLLRGRSSHLTTRAAAVERAD
jgi:class 3 adenylate cyclase